jgi:hypothetical protein
VTSFKEIPGQNIVCQKMAPHGKQMTPEEKQIIEVQTPLEMF